MLVVELVQLKDNITSDSTDLGLMLLKTSVLLNKDSEVYRLCRMLTTNTGDEHLVEAGIPLKTCQQTVLNIQFNQK